MSAARYWNLYQLNFLTMWYCAFIIFRCEMLPYIFFSINIIGPFSRFFVFFCEIVVVGAHLYAVVELYIQILIISLMKVDFLNQTLFVKTEKYYGSRTSLVTHPSPPDPRVSP